MVQRGGRRVMGAGNIKILDGSFFGGLAAEKFPLFPLSRPSNPQCPFPSFVKNLEDSITFRFHPWMNGGFTWIAYNFQHIWCSFNFAEHWKHKRRKFRKKWRRGDSFSVFLFFPHPPGINWSQCELWGEIKWRWRNGRLAPSSKDKT